MYDSATKIQPHLYPSPIRLLSDTTHTMNTSQAIAMSMLSLNPWIGDFGRLWSGWVGATAGRGGDRPGRCAGRGPRFLGGGSFVGLGMGGRATARVRARAAP